MNIGTFTVKEYMRALIRQYYSRIHVLILVENKGDNESDMIYISPLQTIRVAYEDKKIVDVLLHLLDAWSNFRSTHPGVSC